MSANLPEFFDGTEMPDAEWWEALWPDPAAVVAAVGVKHGMDVVDLCSGDGLFTLPIARIARRVAAIDIDAGLLRLARRRLDQKGIANCDFVAGSAHDLAALVQWAPSFVFMANAFHGVPDQPLLAGAVRSVLKPGGRVAIVNWHHRPREETVVLGAPRGPMTGLRMTPRQTIEAVEAGDLAFAELVELPPYHYGAVFEKAHD